MNKLVILSTLALPLILTGCGTTGGPGGGGGGGGGAPLTPPTASLATPTTGPALAYSASTNHTTAATTATLSMAADGSVLNVTLDGQTFALPQVGSTQQGTMTAYEFGSTTGNGNIAAVVAQQHSYASVGAINADEAAGTMDSGWVTIGGNATSAMPTNIAANYSGIWTIYVPTLSVEAAATGAFTATLDLTGGNNTVIFDAQGNTVTGVALTGGGGGTVTGNAFQGNFGMASADMTTIFDGGLEGQFFGPNAEEVAGIMQGNAKTPEAPLLVDSAGFLIGTKQ